jgi:hypothetical protein
VKHTFSAVRTLPTLPDGVRIMTIITVPAGAEPVKYCEDLGELAQMGNAKTTQNVVNLMRRDAEECPF